MALWFVYNGMDYYPFAKVIAAETAEQAAERVRETGSDDPVAVFPLDALAYKHDGDQGTAWLERFD